MFVGKFVCLFVRVLDVVRLIVGLFLCVCESVCLFVGGGVGCCFFNNIVCLFLFACLLGCLFVRFVLYRVCLFILGVVWMGFFELVHASVSIL